jgi:hypothetical protein
MIKNYGLIIVYLRLISSSNIPEKRQRIEYMDCALLRNCEVIDTIMVKAVGPNAYRTQMVEACK